ncbi:hypothetical protein IEQ34_007016 [Dendrobium chrysotoxum]|uniref:Uncharacterized protein n=1 Tax=Dendrobium chrysotoxum TaxID=161865 RepID=A0AAV7H859_DENCH|nr:hypothetical protein IEQ34_007016 [Dendrobium chrysotoxum]
MSNLTCPGQNLGSNLCGQPNRPDRLAGAADLHATRLVHMARSVGCSAVTPARFAGHSAARLACSAGYLTRAVPRMEPPSRPDATVAAGGDFPYSKSTIHFGAEVDMGDPTSTKNPSTKGDRFVARREGVKKTYKAKKMDDVVSTVTGEALLAFRKKYYFPNDMVVKVPARSDRACSPPLGFVTVYEFSLRASLRFPPSPELSDILMICGASLAQLSYRAMSIIMGLIVLFRDRGAVLSPDCLARMGRLIGDTQCRISFRSKWLDIRTRDPAKELLKILKFSDIDTLHYEVHYLSRYIDEEYLFKVGLSTHAGRSHAQMLKKSKSAAFKIIIEDHIQEARNHIYDVEVKALEADCMEEGFIRGFMKGVRVVQRKTGAEIDGLTPSQASGDPSSDSGGEEIESEL